MALLTRLPRVGGEGLLECIKGNNKSGQGNGKELGRLRNEAGSI